MKNGINATLIFVFSLFLVMGLIFVAIGVSNSELIFAAVGSIFALVGGAALVSILYRGHIQAKVRAMGIALYTDAVDVILEDTRVNNIQGYRVRTQWLDPTTNTLYYFQSNYLQENPTDKVINMKKIKVLVNPSNYGQYYMELPF